MNIIYIIDVTLTTNSNKGEKTMKTKRIMPKTQKEAVLKMDSGEVLDFQIRLQVECGMSHQEAADYIAQAYA